RLRVSHNGICCVLLLMRALCVPYFFGAAAQQLKRCQQKNGYSREQGGNSQDRRIDLLAQPSKHLARNGSLLWAGQKQYQHNFIEGGDKGEECTRDDAWPDQRNDNIAENPQRRRAHAESCPVKRLIETGQGGGDGNDHKGNAQRGMGDDDAGISSYQIEARIEKEHSGGDNDEWNDHGRQQQGGDEAS